MAIIIRNSNLFCDKCGQEYKISYPIAIPMIIAMEKEFEKMHKHCKQTWKEPEVDLTKPIKERMKFWLKYGERGVSSETMFSVLGVDNFGEDICWCRSSFDYCHPYDPDDFRRCYLLLKMIPEWKSELYKLGHISPAWRNLVNNWDKLTEMLEEQMKTKKPNGMYELMQECIKKII